MSAYFSSQEREDNPLSLPDIEVFYFDPDAEEGFTREKTESCSECAEEPEQLKFSSVSNRTLCFCCFEEENPCGWYWQSCFPGCLPDGDPVGPFPSEVDALEDARDF